MFAPHKPVSSGVPSARVRFEKDPGFRCAPPWAKVCRHFVARIHSTFADFPHLRDLRVLLCKSILSFGCSSQTALRQQGTCSGLVDP
jgi:hypothetical protein